MTTFSTLAHEVFESRMSGPLSTADHVESLFRWIDKIPRMEPPAAADPAAVERGRALFNQPDLACATCHNGEKLTNSATVNVQTEGGAFQVPSLLGLAWRAPYMHNGCAATLADRFSPCGGGDAHGQTSKLTADQLADLVAYLDTL
jgi:mono/diheme cytochrome c family protein